MSAVPASAIAADRQRWLAMRRQGIGGSDAGIILGLSPYKTPYTLWLEKRGEVQSDDETSDAAHFGNVLEGVVAQEYTRRTGRKVHKVNRLLRHQQHPFMIGNIDRRVVGEQRLLECKTAGFWAAKNGDWGEPGSDEVPLQYVAQVQHYLALTGYEVADLAVLVAGNDFRIYEIPRDPELISGLIFHEEAFWRCVETGEPPAPINAADAASRWPRNNGEIIEADEDLLEAIEDLRAIKTKAKDLAAFQMERELQIKTALGEASALVGADGKPLATWKTQTTRRLDQRALKAAHPDLAQQFTTTTESRVLRVK